MPLLRYYPNAQATDLGCGRGEWLELLTENGFSVQGIDLDRHMLSACRERNLAVHEGDAIGFLKALPDNSQIIISGFHLVEHIPFDDVRRLVDEALRVLKPGGIIILETPNPENLVVGSCNFYLDPTHNRPVPPLLLSFLVEYCGFYRARILRLQELAALVKNDEPSLINVLNGASPDYAVVAQKNGSIELQNITADVFDAEYGLSMEVLADRFQKKLQSTQEKIINLEDEIQHKHLQLQEKINHLGAEIQHQQLQLHGVLNSRSWRITKPLRVTGDIIRRFKAWVKSKLKNSVRKFVSWIQSFPRLKNMFDAFLDHFPYLKMRIHAILRSEVARPLPINEGVEALGPHAKNIYVGIKKAVAEKKRGS
jgi:O-antigen chain-terminating methyltransferase